MDWIKVAQDRSRSEPLWTQQQKFWSCKRLEVGIS